MFIKALVGGLWMSCPFSASGLSLQVTGLDTANVRAGRTLARTWRRAVGGETGSVLPCGKQKGVPCPISIFPFFLQILFHFHSRGYLESFSGQTIQRWLWMLEMGGDEIEMRGTDGTMNIRKKRKT